MKLSRLFLPLLFTLSLLFVQQSGFAHGISHTLAEQQEQSLPHDKHCDLCAVYAQLDSAVGSTPFDFAVLSQRPSELQSNPVSYLSATLLAFAARAPPSFA